MTNRLLVLIFYLHKVFVLCDSHEFHFEAVFDLELWLRTDETHKQIVSLSGENVPIVAYLSTTRKHNTAWKWMENKASKSARNSRSWVLFSLLFSMGWKIDLFSKLLCHFNKSIIISNWHRHRQTPLPLRTLFVKCGQAHSKCTAILCIMLFHVLKSHLCGCAELLPILFLHGEALLNPWHFFYSILSAVVWIGFPFLCLPCKLIMSFGHSIDCINAIKMVRKPTDIRIFIHAYMQKCHC